MKNPSTYTRWIGRVSSIGSCPPCGSIRGSADPIENSPPGIQTIRSGAGAAGVPAFGTVASKSDPAGLGGAAVGGAAHPARRNEARTTVGGQGVSMKRHYLE